MVLLKTSSIIQRVSRSVTSKALMYTKYGEPGEVLQLTDRQLPELKSGELLVKMLAAPVNPSDINTIQGVYPVKPPLPAVCGYEGVGKIIKCDSTVQMLKVGDLVIPAGVVAGTWQTHVCLHQDKIFQIDPKLPIEAAAILSVNPGTAYRMLHDFVTLRPGDIVIQNGATSAVGIYVIQIAKIMGWKTINLFRERATKEGTEETRHTLLENGATWAVTDAELADLLKDTPAPKLALNCLGGKPAISLLRALDESGTLVTYGGMARSPMPVSVSPLLFKDVRLRGFWITKWMKQSSRSEREAMLRDLSSWFISGQMKTSPSTKLSLDDWKKAIDMSTFTTDTPSSIKGKAIFSME